MLDIGIAIIPMLETWGLGASRGQSAIELRPVAGRSLLARAIYDAVDAGVDEIVIVAGSGKTLVKKHVKHICQDIKNTKGKCALNIQLEFRTKPAGIGSILTELELREPLRGTAIILPHYVSKGNSFQLKNLMRTSDKESIVYVVEPTQRYNTPSNHSVFSGNSKSVKVALPLLEHVGRYLLPPMAVKALLEHASSANRGDLLDQLFDSYGAAGKLKQVYAEGTVFNCRTECGHLAASVALALEDPDSKLDLLQEFASSGVMTALTAAVDEKSHFELANAIEQAYAKAGHH